MNVDASILMPMWYYDELNVYVLFKKIIKQPMIANYWNAIKTNEIPMLHSKKNLIVKFSTTKQNKKTN